MLTGNCTLCCRTPQVLEAQGHSLLSPSDRAGLHPLLIPLTTFNSSSGSGACACACMATAAEAVAVAVQQQPHRSSSLLQPRTRRPALLLRTRCTADARQVLGLLRWPQPSQHKAMPLPLVSMSREGSGLTLQARSVDEYLHRWGCATASVAARASAPGVRAQHACTCAHKRSRQARIRHAPAAAACCRRPPAAALRRLLAEEDVAGGPGPVSAAAGDDGAELYSPGGVEAAGFGGKLNLYIIRKVCWRSCSSTAPCGWLLWLLRLHCGGKLDGVHLSGERGDCSSVAPAGHSAHAHDAAQQHGTSCAAAAALDRRRCTPPVLPVQPHGRCPRNARHMQVGMFPDVCEALSLGHLARGDATSAMVASEWYMRNNHFPGWGRPYEFASELFQKVLS